MYMHDIFLSKRFDTDRHKRHTCSYCCTMHRRILHNVGIPIEQEKIHTVQSLFCAHLDTYRSTI